VKIPGVSSDFLCLIETAESKPAGFRGFSDTSESTSTVSLRL
jgi:hypothetical protein